MTELNLLTISAAARDFRVPKDTLRRWLEQSGSAPAGRRGNADLYALAEVASAVRRHTDAEQLPPQDRLAIARAIEIEQRTMVARRELLSTYQIARLLRSILRTLGTAPDARSTEFEYRVRDIVSAPVLPKVLDVFDDAVALPSMEAAYSVAIELREAGLPAELAESLMPANVTDGLSFAKWIDECETRLQALESAGEESDDQETQ